MVFTSLATLDSHGHSYIWIVPIRQFRIVFDVWCDKMVFTSLATLDSHGYSYLWIIPVRPFRIMFDVWCDKTIFTNLVTLGTLVIGSIRTTVYVIPSIETSIRSCESTSRMSTLLASLSSSSIVAAWYEVWCKFYGNDRDRRVCDARKVIVFFTWDLGLRED